MNRNKLQSVIENVYRDSSPRRKDIEYLLNLKDSDEIDILFNYADNIRKSFCGEGIIVRAIVEFSSYCRNRCMYCGLNSGNTNLKRYRLSDSELMGAIENICSAGIKTVVLQSGEDSDLDPDWLKGIIVDIRNNFDIAVTLSVGERTYEEYELWRQAGADRFLLKIETVNKRLYKKLHPGMSFDNRFECSRNLQILGYENGSGSIVGLKGQTARMLAEDILFFKENNFDMISIGLFVPHQNTPLRDMPTGSLQMALKMLALTRIVTKYTHMPVTTSLRNAGGETKALQAGANVIMLNFTPMPYRNMYEIYPDKNCTEPHQQERFGNLTKTASTTGRFIDYSTGSSLKHKHVHI